MKRWMSACWMALVAAPAFAACSGGRPPTNDDPGNPSGAGSPGGTPGSTAEAGVPGGSAPGTAGGAGPGAGSPGGAGDGGLPQKPGTIEDDAGDAGRDGALGPCVRATTGLDLAALTPGPSVPAAFAAAWTSERRASLAPPLVLGLRNLGGSGVVSAQIGPVNQVSTTDWRFEAPPLSITRVNVTVDPNDIRHLTIPNTTGTIVLSYGDSTTRRGFSAFQFRVDGRLTSQCDGMIGSMTLVLSSGDANQAFGGSTVGALLGAPNFDANNNGVDDSWKLDFTGRAEGVNVEVTP